MEKLTIKSWALDDRPREKLLIKGKGALSDAELVAILIASGNRHESAVELSKRNNSSPENNSKKSAVNSHSTISKNSTVRNKVIATQDNNNKDLQKIIVLSNNSVVEIENKITNLLAEYKRPYIPKRGNSNCQFEVISQCLLKFLRINNWLLI